MRMKNMTKHQFKLENIERYKLGESGGPTWT